MNVKVLSLLLAGLPLVASAMPPGPSSPPQAATEAWLQLQPSGRQASTTVQNSTPREYDKSMERWMKVYDYKIPEVFKWEKMSSGGAGGSK
ncbi:DUF3613 domain-containing protein [Pseudomonas wadenswilerensis]